jgi:hypothetical protein
MMLPPLHMLCLLIELCLLNLACLIIKFILLVGIKEKVLNGLITKIQISSPHAITVVLVVISAQIAFRYGLKNLGKNSMCLEKMKMVLRTKSKP